jgi:hypothetical protein
MGRRKTPAVAPWTPPTWLARSETPMPNDTDANVIPGVGVYTEAELSVRPVRGSQATKRYDCPICNQTIAIGVPHTVVVPLAQPDHRRHFHTPCWQARTTRRPKT